MSYIRLNKDGSSTVMGEITGYRVLYKDMDGAKKKSKPFSYFWQANQFRQHLQFGSGGIIVPLYEADKAKSA